MGNSGPAGYELGDTTPWQPGPPGGPLRGQRAPLNAPEDYRALPIDPYLGSSSVPDYPAPGGGGSAPWDSDPLPLSAVMQRMGFGFQRPGPPKDSWPLGPTSQRFTPAPSPWIGYSPETPAAGSQPGPVAPLPDNPWGAPSGTLPPEWRYG